MKLPEVVEGIIVQEIGDETLVYVPQYHSAHALSGPVAVVLSALVAKRGIHDLMLELDVAAGVDKESLIAEIVEELEAMRIVEVPESRFKASLGPVNTARRDFIKQAAALALTAPLITSISLPHSAEAAASTCLSSCGGTPGVNDAKACDPAGGTDCSAGDTCFTQFTCNGPTSGAGCNAGACNTTDFAGGTNCILANGTFIQASCAAARAQAHQDFAGSNQYSYVCQKCPS